MATTKRHTPTPKGRIRPTTVPKTPPVKVESKNYRQAPLRTGSGRRGQSTIDRDLL